MQSRSEIRFYTLTPQPPATPVSQDAGLVLGVGPVRIPDLIDRAEIVTRLDPQQVRLEGRDLWAGALRDNLGGVLAEDLARLLGTRQWLRYPWSGDGGIDLQVTLDLLALEGTPGGEAHLSAGWSLIDGRSRRVLKIGHSRHAAPVGETSVAALVATYSRLVAALAEEVAREIAALRHGASPGL
jgi:uncharacterized protein